jgi:benzoyl-CoA reductase subunit C
MSALKKLLEYGQNNPPAAVDEWKKMGNKVVGYWCSYVPPELICAAGALPYRVRGMSATNTEKADHDMSPVCNCTFPRAVLDLAYRGVYNFLDGVIGMNGCDHSRRAFELWVERLHPSYHHFVYVPRTKNRVSVEKYIMELEKFKASLEKYLGTQVTPEALKQAVDLYNENRSLLKQVQEMFKEDHPPLTGTQWHTIINASMSISPKQLNQLLRALLEEMKDMPDQKDSKVRIMIVGWVGDNTPVHQIIEESGGLVVMDNCCFGARSFWKSVSFDPQKPIVALAQSYLDGLACPRMFDSFTERYHMVQQAVKDYKVDGIFRTRLQFCDLHGVENVFWNRRREEMGAPMSAPIVLDYVGQDEGRIRTRIEAFVEQLQK